MPKPDYDQRITITSKNHSRHIASGNLGIDVEGFPESAQGLDDMILMVRCALGALEARRTSRRPLELQQTTELNVSDLVKPYEGILHELRSVVKRA